MQLGAAFPLTPALSLGRGSTVDDSDWRNGLVYATATGGGKEAKSGVDAPLCPRTP